MTGDTSGANGESVTDALPASSNRARIVVYHSSYGCDTGCCGHVVEVGWPDGRSEERFEFSHPCGDDFMDFAKELVRETFGDEHVADLDWENCYVTDAC